MWLSFARLAGVLSPFPILLACASAGARDANVITAPELSRSTARNTYDAIRQIRPEMLRARDPGTVVYFKARQPVVAMDNTIVGGIDGSASATGARRQKYDGISSRPRPFRCMSFSTG